MDRPRSSRFQAHVWFYNLLVRATLVVGTASFAPASASGLDPFMEATTVSPLPYFARGGGDRPASTPFPYTLEASIAPTIVMTSSLRPMNMDRPGIRHSFVFVPRVDLRQRRVKSLPIPTPGFWPTLHFRGYLDQPLASGTRLRWMAELRVAHLSNGQSGCLRKGTEPGTGELCEPIAGQMPGTELEHVDGSFAINETGLRLALSISPDARAERVLSVGVGGILFRPYAGGLDPELRALYGHGRTELQIGLIDRSAWHPSTHWIADLKLETRLDAHPDLRPWTVSLDLMLRVPRLRHWGPWLRVHDGPDHYNVRFDRNCTIISLGLMWRPPLAGATRDAKLGADQGEPRGRGAGPRRNPVR